MNNIINIGDRVLVTKPDPEYGCACIASSYDAAYLVKSVSDDGKKLHIETRLVGMAEPMPIDAVEVTKTDRLPWWVSS